MIAKHVPIRSLKKSDFDILYLLLACNNLAKNIAKKIK